MTRFVFVLLLTGAFGAPVSAARPECTDISSVDFRNRVIVAHGEARHLSYGVFNGPGPGGPIPLPCENGRVTKLFEASGQGPKLEGVTDRAIDVSVAVWAPVDDHASPSRVVPLTYMWAPKSRRYVRVSSNADCSWMP